MGFGTAVRSNLLLEFAIFVWITLNNESTFGSSVCVNTMDGMKNRIFLKSLKTASQGREEISCFSSPFVKHEHLSMNQILIFTSSVLLRAAAVWILVYVIDWCVWEAL